MNEYDPMPPTPHGPSNKPGAQPAPGPAGPGWPAPPGPGAAPGWSGHPPAGSNPAARWSGSTEPIVPSYAAPTPATVGPGLDVGGYTGRRVGKIRNPFAVWLLGILTCGIYSLYWWYSVNQEAKNYEPRLDVEPTLSLLALFVPIANIVSVIRTGGRIQTVQRSSGLAPSCSGGVGFLLMLLLGLHVVYYQSALNSVWARHGNLPEGSAV